MNSPRFLCLSRRRYTILFFKALFVFLTTLLLTVAAFASAQTTPLSDTTSVHLASILRPVLSVAPGGSYQGEIVLVNEGGRAANVQVSQVDFLPDAGNSSYPEPGSLPRSNAAWINLSQDNVQIPAGGRVVVPYAIQVPNDSSLVGSYWSMILLTPSDAASVQQTQEGRVQTSVLTQFRYGVSVVTNFGDSGESQMSFEKPHFERPQDGAAAYLQVSLRNTGERLLEPDAHLELYDESGAQVNRFEAQAKRIFPGTSVHQNFELGKLAPGEYTAVVIVDAGGEDVFGTRYTLNVGSGKTP